VSGHHSAVDTDSTGHRVHSYRSIIDGRLTGATVPVPPKRIAVVQSVTPRLRPTPPPGSTAGAPRTDARGGDLHDSVVVAFTAVFEVATRPFCTVRGRYRRISDNAEGVQRNAGVDRHESTAVAQVRRARTVLQPVYDFVRDRY